MTNFQTRAVELTSTAVAGQTSFIITRLSQQKPSTTRFTYEGGFHSEFLRSRGFFGYEDFWNLPHDFVDDINYRKGGWSGVSVLNLWDKNSQRNYYVKRQVNQFRYSLKKPFGALTFEYEAEAIARSQALGLPAIDIACWGVRREAGSTMGLLVTEEIGFSSLEDILATQKFSPTLGVLLYRCGEQLLEMHSHGIQHGALYPKHIFVDQHSGAIKLIDFERSRKKGSIHKAMRADLRQLLKHLKALPHEVIEMLLSPYQKKHSRLLSDLQS
ncbi:MAG: tRNA A-37 threonylcarbamoyl transferase component Bud32 [Pseudohongiellaceae bacterium]|jgi:tRNA A-37 threonylcarbamoyl transferase component Bud32|nr:hypothetical protein [Pseudomonadota bacterium]